jgi:hypothetical protein
MSMKNSNDTIWNRTSNLPICSTIPEPLCHHQRSHSVIIDILNNVEELLLALLKQQYNRVPNGRLWTHVPVYELCTCPFLFKSCWACLRSLAVRFVQNVSLSFSVGWRRKHKIYQPPKLLCKSPKSCDLHGNGTGHHCQYRCSSRILNSTRTRLRVAQAWKHVVTAQKEIRGHLSPLDNCNMTYTKLCFPVLSLKLFVFP